MRWPLARADIALALGVEKLKDTGYGGLPQRGRGPLNDMTNPNGSAPGNFAQLAAAYTSKHGVDPKDLKRAMAHISVKSHDNGARNPKAHLRNKITIEHRAERSDVAEPLGLYDCCGVSDGSACAIVTTPEIAKAMGKKDLVSVKALQLSVSNGLEAQHNSWDGSYFATTRIAAKRAYQEAGIERPREQVSLIEVHDCFSVTELVTMEDLHISAEGGAIKDVLDGFYDSDGKLHVPDRWRLEVFRPSHRRSGLRMIYEMYLQLQGRAGERQRKQERCSASRTTSAACRCATWPPSPSSASTARNARLRAARMPASAGNDVGCGARCFAPIVIPAKAGIHASPSGPHTLPHMKACPAGLTRRGIGELTMTKTRRWESDRGDGRGARHRREIAMLAAARAPRLWERSRRLGEGEGATRASLTRVVDEIRAAGGIAVSNGDSVADPQGAERIIQTAIENFGRIDCVVNNAGILRDRIFHRMSAVTSTR